jgi:hypothetical protein
LGFVGVTKLAEQAASPVFMGCTCAVAFQERQLVRKGRREAAQKGLASKRQQRAEYVATVTIEVPRLEREQRINEACDNYDERNDYRSFVHTGSNRLQRALTLAEKAAFTPEGFLR